MSVEQDTVPGIRKQVNTFYLSLLVRSLLVRSLIRFEQQACCGRSPVCCPSYSRLSFRPESERHRRRREESAFVSDTRMATA